MNPLFSVVVIARNESKTLPRLLESLKDFRERGREIVVVDTGSTDSTAQIAQDFGCVVFEEGERFVQTIDLVAANEINGKFLDQREKPIVKEGDRLFDFSAARNYAVSKATNDWVIMADCDEVFTSLNVEALNIRICGEKRVDRFEFDFVYAHDGLGNPLIQFRQSRFYDRRKYLWNPKNIVHEVLISAGADEGKTIYLHPLQLKLEHWQNEHTNRSGYLVGLAVDCFLHPGNDRNSHYFARELFYHKRYRSAIREFQRHIEMKAWPVEQAQSMIYMGDCYAALGDTDTALKRWVDAFWVDGTRRESLMRLAWYFFGKGDHHRTAAYAAAALAIPKVGFYMDNENHYRQEPHELLYWALWYLGDKAESKRHWQVACSYQPHNPKYLSDSQFFV